jgi:hypothetical protein
VSAAGAATRPPDPSNRESTTTRQDEDVSEPQPDHARAAAAPTPGAPRCSDAERERTCAVLHAAAGDGRLTLDEVEVRLAGVYAARHRHELDASSPISRYPR